VVHVALLTFNCPAFSGRLTYGLRQDRATVQHSITARKDEAGRYDFDLHASPGHYQLWIDAIVAQTPAPDALPVCSTQQYFTTIAGHDRHLIAVLGINDSVHFNCALVGTLPVEGLQVSLVLPKGHTMAETVVGGTMGPAQADEDYGAIVDGDAYYAEHVTGEDYELRIGQAKIPVDLTKWWDVKDPYCDGVFERDVTINDLRDAFPASFMTE
jgi:hypothetical protein